MAAHLGKNKNNILNFHLGIILNLLVYASVNWSIVTIKQKYNKRMILN